MHARQSVFSVNDSVVFEIHTAFLSFFTETSYNLEKLWIKKAAFALLAVGFVFQGIGKSPRYPFVTLYIDDAVNKRKTGFYMGKIV